MKKAENVLYERIVGITYIQYMRYAISLRYFYFDLKGVEYSYETFFSSEDRAMSTGNIISELTGVELIQ